MCHVTLEFTGHARLQNHYGGVDRQPLTELIFIKLPALCHFVTWNYSYRHTVKLIVDYQLSVLYLIVSYDKFLIYVTLKWPCGVSVDNEKFSIFLPILSRFIDGIALKFLLPCAIVCAWQFEFLIWVSFPTLIIKAKNLYFNFAILWL